MRFLLHSGLLLSSALAEIPVARSIQSGAWSEASTWEKGKLPALGSAVLIKSGHTVVYDVATKEAVRSVHIAGTLTFDPSKDTQLNAGLIRVQQDESTREEGFECDAHLPEPKSSIRGSLLVGTAEKPIPAERQALIRLVMFEGMNAETLPAIVDCGGRMEFHGAEMNRTWVKLAAAGKKGDDTLTLAEAVTGWRAGDKLVIVGTTRQSKHPDRKTFREHAHDLTETEERMVKSISGTQLVLDAPLAYTHTVEGRYRGEVANLSRNVIVESADPTGARGHTMYHRGSSGAVRYAEFRHLGKEGVLGRYSLHFHLVRDTMRGTSVVGASIWDSANRWLTIHGTDYLVVRDCIGYKSIGHGYFLEDGTEVFNVLDRNLAIQAAGGKPLPKQVLPFDHNDGAGFWWANSMNTFTRNVAAECDEYGYRFDAVQTADFSLTLNVPKPDGTRHAVDIRTLPFVKFAENESHTQRRHAFNFGGFSALTRSYGDKGKNEGVAGVGPDEQHPFVITDYLAWDVHWALHPRPPCVMVDVMEAAHSHYALWFANYDRHAYRGIKLLDITVNPDFQPLGTQPKPTDYPGKLQAVDDLPPCSVITSVIRQADGSLRVCGTTTDNGEVSEVLLNGQPVKATAALFAQWEAALPHTAKLSARAKDSAGNSEPRPHEVQVPAL